MLGYNIVGGSSSSHSESWRATAFRLSGGSMEKPEDWIRKRAAKLDREVAGCSVSISRVDTSRTESEAGYHRVLE